MDDLASKKCVPCEGGTAPMTKDDAKEVLRKIQGWELVEGEILKIRKKYNFKNFKQSLAFVNRVGKIAEEQGHHPDINFGWAVAEITLYTHAIKGLFENDFILAAKIDKIS